MKLPQVFVNSLPSKVGISFQIMEKFTVRKFYEIQYFQQARPIERLQHNGFESSIMSSQVVYCSIIL